MVSTAIRIYTTFVRSLALVEGMNLLPPSDGVSNARHLGRGGAQCVKTGNKPEQVPYIFVVPKSWAALYMCICCQCHVSGGSKLFTCYKIQCCSKCCKHLGYKASDDKGNGELKVEAVAEWWCCTGICVN
jgi:hypothetical protein